MTGLYMQNSKQKEIVHNTLSIVNGFLKKAIVASIFLIGFYNVSAAEEDVCQRVIGSQCDASQEAMLDALLKDMNVYGYVEQKLDHDGKAPAFELLPKDTFGLVNWTKAEADGLIAPRSAINETTVEEKPKEAFFENIILLQTAAHFMPDVLFPHGIHSNMISCDSCHPKPFEKKNGANKIRMAEIFEGKWCGKCHGKIAFPVQKFNNCRRCHMMKKTAFGKPSPLIIE